MLITNKLEVAFTKLEGVGCRPIAHTCGPVLELPSTYANFVELREQFRQQRFGQRYLGNGYHVSAFLW